MFRIRVKFSKGEELKFLSHLDIVRTINRVIRRAEIPFILTSGFSPHLKITFSPPLPVGITGSSDFFDLFIYKEENVSEIKNRLSLSSPEGLKIIEVRYLPDEFIPLSKLSYCEYEIISEVQNIDEEKIEKIKKFLTQDKIILKRITPKCEKEFDLKKLIFKFDFKIENKNIIFNLIIPLNIRPEEIFKLQYFDFLNLEILKINRKLLCYQEKDKILPLI